MKQLLPLVLQYFETVGASFGCDLIVILKVLHLVFLIKGTPYSLYTLPLVLSVLGLLKSFLRTRYNLGLEFENHI